MLLRSSLMASVSLLASAGPARAEGVVTSTAGVLATRTSSIATRTATVALLEPTKTATRTAEAVSVREPNPASSSDALLGFDLLGGHLTVPLMLSLSAEGTSSFPVDRDANDFQPGLALSPLLRVGLEFKRTLSGMVSLFAEYEHDLPTGSWTSDTPVAGEGLPGSAPVAAQLRKAWVRVSYGPFLHGGAGILTSHFGLGLVANDGAHAWTPGSARFLDPRAGDVVLRGFVSTGPLTDAELVIAMAVDNLQRDDARVEGDSAYQFVASALVELPVHAGMFFVHRRQTSEDGRYLDVSLFDLTARVSSGPLTLEVEAALATGGTSLGGSPEIPDSDVLQLGAVARASLSFSTFGAVVDLVYASGDPNAHDAHATGFHADPSLETGLLLFRSVQAAQTGRGYGTAADPMLVGAPPAGIERLPTRGGLTNALVAFPRLWVRPVADLETYGGVLVAVAPEKTIDPFNTDLAGGPPRNALDRDPGSYLGTELDLGIRYSPKRLSFGAEGGVLFPGSAIGDSKPVFGGRLMAGCRL
ncbi:MAG: hypothetical protein HY791_36510 [Deltaproteobacteria bacterium]|nr:hypothetical protein [Deltaproteobacteria bacterium]